MLSTSDQDLIEQERLRSVFQNAPVTLVATVVNASVTAVVIPSTGDNWLRVWWLLATFTVCAVRFAISRRFLTQGPNPAGSTIPWGAFSIIGSATTGFLWGLGGIILFPAAASYQLFLSMVIAGMCAGAITVNAMHLPTVLAFILPASLQLTALFIYQGPDWRMSGFMFVIFAVALTVISMRSHRIFGERIGLQIELGRQKVKLTEANARLRQEIEQREVAEATLFQAQKMEAIGQLTGGIAHDFNNLLQVIIGNTNLIRSVGSDNPKIINYASAAEQAATRGAELTGSLLTFARRQAMIAKKVDLNQLLREFEPLLIRTLVATIHFKTNLMPTPPCCDVDPAHFQSAVLNLVINARDAMPDGGTLTVSSTVATLGPDILAGNPDAMPGRFVGITIADTGTGMTDAVLSQVYGFARQSGGHVELKSKPGKGTRATIWLPVAQISAPADRIPTLCESQ
jgi:signal transduction histidine kinase